MNDFNEADAVQLKLTVKELYVLYRRLRAAGVRAHMNCDVRIPEHHEVVAVARSRHSNHYTLTIAP